MSRRPPRTLFVVPVTIADERLVEVEARSKGEAEQRVRDGKYRRLGKSQSRGFLLVGEALPKGQA